MPAAAIVAGAATVGGAYLQHRGQTRAAEEQRRAAEQAINLERERDAESRRRYDMQWQRYQAELDAYNARRIAVLRRHGYDIPEPAPLENRTRMDVPGMAPSTPGPVAGGPAPVTGPAVGLPSAPMAPAPAVPMTPSTGLPTLTPAEGAPAPGGDPALMQGMSLTDLPRQWSDWRNYAATA